MVPADEKEDVEGAAPLADDVSVPYVTDTMSVDEEDDVGAANPPRCSGGSTVTGRHESALEKKNVSEATASDDEAWSDISDNSNIFHVATVVSDAPRTREDVDLAIVESIVPYLRKYPFLPSDDLNRYRVTNSTMPKYIYIYIYCENDA